MRFTVLTTMKNEGAFLIEWVAHHKALGFDAIVICTNDCDDPTTDMVLRLQRMGLARHHATTYAPGSSIQRAAIRSARRYDEVRTADWIYITDADEFLTIRIGDGTVQALVAAASPGAEVISIPWRTFGPDGRLDYEDRPVTQQFLRAARTPAADELIGAFPKSIFRGGETLAALERLGIHAPIIRPDAGRDLRRELPGGVPLIPLPAPLLVQADYRFAQINHYVLRSRDSFLVKRDRGKVNHVEKDMAFNYWARNDKAEEPCDAIRRYDAEAARWRDTLMADARLAMLHHRAVRWHRNRIAALKKDKDFRKLIAQIDARIALQAAGGPLPEEDIPPDTTGAQN
jgi:Glycosyl transferase family 2